MDNGKDDVVVPANVETPFNMDTEHAGKEGCIVIYFSDKGRVAFVTHVKDGTVAKLKESRGPLPDPSSFMFSEIWGRCVDDLAGFGPYILRKAGYTLNEAMRLEDTKARAQYEEANAKYEEAMAKVANEEQQK